MITYDRSCADGAMHSIELQLANYCGGSDAETKPYRARLDSASFTPIPIKVGQVASVGDADVTVPVELSAPVTEQVFWSASFDILFDEGCMQFVAESSSGGL